ncbi:Low-density lipoprotein receptor- protein 2 [Bulinus truncatus]|nr:Low-density lipoprotein receptor- protein 2 [Bulinus truncatus]
MVYLLFFNFVCFLLISSNAYSTSASNPNITCEINQIMCGDNCLSLSWKCDGTQDCFDGSDELDCPPTTCSSGFFRCHNGNCISDRWHCDGSEDCKDNSDELSCDTGKTCDVEEYQCLNTSKCIPHGWVCDGQSDCQFGDDENNTNCTSVCDKSEFQCNNEQCISIQWRCDGTKDCKDGSDEMNCTKKSDCDTETDKKCKDGACITSSWWCDGDTDCQDGSDEKNCTQPSTNECGPTEFQCLSPLEDLQCIHMAWKCDGDEDCSDGSDEKNCTEHSCPADERRCHNDSFCINLSYFCDGESDCRDESDELNCNTTSACPSDQFSCNNGTCIPVVHVCDGLKQCKDGEDEDAIHCSPESCKENNGLCMHTCVPNLKGHGRTCQCNPGFELLHNSETTCQDINECDIPGTCSQECVNTKGSYHCKCGEGYTLVNQTFCKAKWDKHAELILSDHHSLRRLHLDTFQYKIIFGSHLAVAMDFSITENKLFWTDVKSKKVFVASLNADKPAVVIHQNLSIPDGLAVDWIHRNLYVTDTGLNTIEVSRLDGSHRKTLVYTDLDDPRAIVLDPQNGWMYWTDWGSEPKIEKCGMNGQNRKTIVTRNVMWPNGLTIDYIQKRLYWVDAKLHMIVSSNLDGEDNKIVLKSHYHLGHPFSVTVFEDNLYWTDWSTNSVKKFNKFGKGNVTCILQNLNHPTDLHVYHLSRQPITASRCGDNNGGCSYLCLPRPQEDSKMSYECACPNGMKFGTGEKQHQCIPSDENINIPKPNTEDTNSNGINRINTTHMDSPTTEPNKPKGSEESSTEKVLDHYSGVYNESLSKAADVKSEESSGVIALIVIATLLLIGIATVIIIFLLVRRYKKRNIKSMNFDNPVYRKTTTEDQLIMNKSESRTSLPSSLQPLTQEHEYVV